jgi:uroporphyrinogen-III synthase
MSKKPKAAANQPLHGISILVGRTRHQAGALSSELRKLGAEVIEIPFIEIRRPKSFRPLDTALKTLNNYDWLILTSVNGVEAMWERLKKVGLPDMRKNKKRNAIPAAEDRLRIAAIGPATKKAIEQHGIKVDVVPKEYVAESVVRSLKKKVKGRRVLLVRAKVARDIIPRELRKAGALVDVVEAYETVVPQSSRRHLLAVLNDPKRRPHVVTFTSSSTVKNFVALLGSRPAQAVRGREHPRHMVPSEIRMASIGPVTSTTLRELGLKADIAAKKFTIPGLVAAIVRDCARGR